MPSATPTGRARNAALLAALLCACKPAAPALDVVRGRVVLDGPAPIAKPLDRHSDPYCEKTARVDESIAADARGGLRDVLVRVAGDFPPATEPRAPALLEQRACTYEPRVLGMLEGQQLLVKNLDGTLHNVHVFRGEETVLNRPQKEGSEPVGRVVPGPPAFLEVKCDVHPWMEAHVYVSANPYFAVTAADGSFELRAPKGHRTLIFWQEALGEQRLEVDVPASGVEIHYSGK